MNSWPPGTRNRVLFVLLVGGGLVALAWFGLVSPLQAQVRVRTAKAELARMQLELAEASLEKAPHYRALAEEKRNEIEAMEALMPTRGLYQWNVRTLAPYEKVYDLILQSWESPKLQDVDMPPEVPYKLASFGVTGLAHFHSFGSFLATFENSWPFVKINEVTLQAVAPGFRAVGDPELLSFRLEYQILARTNAMVSLE
jgi:hypothetical protein